MSETRYAAEFTGSTAEYFRIWIVNLALTLLTLGIYSAWAKVRKRRYFYAHTRIAGEGFEYHARPLAILKGRLIALALAAAFIAAANLLPEWSSRVLLFALGVTVGPWLLVRSLKFNARNTVHRGLQLRFAGTYGGLFKVVIKYVWLIFVGVLYPWFKYRVVEYSAKHHGYGATPFAVDDFKKPFINAYFAAFGLGVVGAIGIAIGGGVAGNPLVATVGFYAGFLLLFAFVRARTTNALWNAVAIGPLRFESSLRGRDFMWIYFTNIVAILATLGFATPWAVIRTLRYRAAHFAMLAAGPLDAFAAAEAGQVGAAGQEVAEMFDLDVGL